jgi:hypothetical protein
MSQINDALRRASDAAKAPGGNSPLAPPPLPEPENEESSEVPLPITEDMLAPPLISQTDEPEPSSKKPVIIVVLVILGTIGFGGYRLWRKFDRVSRSHVSSVEKKFALMDRATALAQSNAARHALASTNFTASAPGAGTQKTAVVETVAPKPAPVIPPKPVTPAVVANSTPAKFPPLRLQSIFYLPSNPSVMINGKLLCISDEIQGVLVADIQPSSVTLVLSGYTNVLTLR